MAAGWHGHCEVGGERSEAGAQDAGCDYDGKVHVIENATDATSATSGVWPCLRNRVDQTRLASLGRRPFVDAGLLEVEVEPVLNLKARRVAA